MSDSLVPQSGGATAVSRFRSGSASLIFSFSGARGLRLIERHARFYRRMWLVVAAGAAEPLFYLLSVGVGIGGLIGNVTGPGGQPVPYREFVAPGLLAVSALNGALNDSTFNIYGRLKFDKLYDAVLTTPLGARDVAFAEIGWAVLRGVIYVMLVAVPMFLFSGTFYPLSVYPHAIGVIVEWSPLYQGVVILRDLVLGLPSPDLAWRAAYLIALGVAGLALAGQRIAKLLLV